MAGKIPAHFIDELLNRIDIVDLINSRVPLKKAGKDYQACCPFHNEKTPSFTVSREKQFYHCFGCGAHGTAIGFLMEYDNLGFVDSIEELASKAGLEVPREGRDESGPDYRPLYASLEKAARYYQWQLRKHPDAGKAINYLKQRGLTGEISVDYGIGYAPPGWDNLIRHMGQTPEALEQLRVTGMISEPEADKCYDRFRERIMFPIRNHRGHTIGFGGRLLGDGKPKYLNSPETPVFHKGRELYGLYEARKALRKIERLLVVEGYMDVVALAQFGIRYAVATLGTATTPEHLERLFRTTSEVIFCFDGDRAGSEAGWKALETALPQMRDGREARFLFLPNGEDPDSLIRKEGREQFEQRIAQATPLSSFLFDKLEEEVDMTSLGGRARLAELAKPLLVKLPGGLFREMMYQRLAQKVGVATEQLGAQPQDQGSNRRRQPVRKKAGAQQMLSPVRRAITLLLLKPELGQLTDLPSQWRDYQAPGIDLLSQLLEIAQNQPNLRTAQIIERWRATPEYHHLEKIWSTATELPTPEEGMETEFRGALQRLVEQQHEQETTQLLERVSTGDASEQEKQRLRQLLSEKQKFADSHRHSD
ncbi:DNA primase [Sedimenticola thiotaurini]|uniref:DNA primase n=1 Tax=Sedimenticola thiotaurini TaxID=1543721 RepID=A0A0F7K0T5_9GAMM|nr:DNA primase [Sedimenticola thiotaurini]AKH21512.1 DNA primase [Sedimenticola thiotaurini]